MKNILIVIFIAIGIYQWAGISNTKEELLSDNPILTQTIVKSNDNKSLTQAFDSHQSNVQVRGSGNVIRILPDDNSGSRHQKFILQLTSGQTVLIAHNIDLAERISSISNNDQIEFYGEYEWNQKGGVVHWTHKDPNKKHTDGWLKHNSRMYQ